ncbi:MAG TPA: hypothetical protein VNY36_09800 [Bacteroidia bacterium]|nr:hypothetical protein [Bacteroidia bacterium]
MNKIGFSLFILLVFLMHSGNAQDKNMRPSQPFRLSRTTLFQRSNNIQPNGIFSNNSPSQNSNTPSPSYSFNYTLPKGAIFCRMEDALHKRFNIWIKFRMGTDDRYSN